MKRMKRIVIEKLPNSSRRYPRFKFSPERPSGKQVIEAEGISKSYDGTVVLDGVRLQVYKGDKLAIIGPNGIGKSTLLKILMDQVEADEGKFEWGYNVNTGYFSQDHAELSPHREASIIDFLWTMHPELGPGHVRGKLAEVLFGKDEVDKKVGHLSGGERSRLLMTHLSVVGPNVLVFDEPTNHLDIEGIESLAKGIREYEGTAIFVSHNRWFVSQTANRVLEITPEGIKDFKGSFAEYLVHCETDYLDAAALRARK
jgi:ATPase subunit of ABC transporter with duplicated ATPase domains